MISVIITAFNEPNTIGRAIEAFLKQKQPDMEILVVCPDMATKKAALKYDGVKVIKDKGKGKPSALNTAFKHARGDVLVLSDGDVYVDKNILRELLGPFQDPKVGAVSGRPVSLSSRKDLFGYWSHFLTDAAHSIRIKRFKNDEYVVCSGYLCAIRARLVKEIPKDALVEDSVISYKILKAGYQIAYASQAQVFVKYPTNFNDWLKQKRRTLGGELQIRTFIGKSPRMRSFLKEALEGSIFALRYPKNLKEFFWTAVLFPARFFAWTLAFWDTKIRKKPLHLIWKRIESTK